MVTSNYESECRCVTVFSIGSRLQICRTKILMDVRMIHVVRIELAVRGAPIGVHIPAHGSTFASSYQKYHITH